MPFIMSGEVINDYIIIPFLFFFNALIDNNFGMFTYSSYHQEMMMMMMTMVMMMIMMMMVVVYDDDDDNFNN